MIVRFSWSCQNLSRIKPATGDVTPVNKPKGKKSPLVEDFLTKRDYLGAITLLEVMPQYYGISHFIRSD